MVDILGLATALRAATTIIKFVFVFVFVWSLDLAMFLVQIIPEKRWALTLQLASKNSRTLHPPLWVFLLRAELLVLGAGVVGSRRWRPLWHQVREDGVLFGTPTEECKGQVALFPRQPT
jgi:hypothetical protein